MALFLDMRWQDHGTWKSERIPCVDGTFTLPESFDEDVISVEEARQRARLESFKPADRREWSLRIGFSR